MCLNTKLLQWMLLPMPTRWLFAVRNTEIIIRYPRSEDKSVTLTFTELLLLLKAESQRIEQRKFPGILNGYFNPVTLKWI